MNIAVFGAGGQIGRVIVEEALNRGHTVTAVVRDPSKFALSHDRLRVTQGDALDTDSVAAVSAGHDAVVSAIGYSHVLNNIDILPQAAHSLIAGLKQAGVRRLLVVGGAGSLFVAPGVRLFDTPEFPEAWRAGAKKHGEALEIYRAERELGWTFFSPAGMIQPGARTGVFRLGGDNLLTDAEGRSNISTEDYAVAVVDELERPAHIRQRFTIAY
jgi:putative NADH-flavin reductase